MTPSSIPCPVPDEQLPINEYQSLVNSWFYRWATLDRRGYVMPMVWIWSLSWLITGPVASYSFNPAKHPLPFFCSSTAGALFLLLLPLLRLYLGWRYIHDRLSQATVFYEESGWYDGQTWEKPTEVLARDRLVVSYQVQPWLQRLQKTFGAVVAGLVTFAILCGILP